MIRVGVITEHQLECTGIRATLAQLEGVSVVAEGQPGDELRLVRHTRLDVLVSCQPAADAALRSLQRLTGGAARRPPTLVLLKRVTGDDVRRLLAFRSVGVLRRCTAATHLPWAVHAVVHGSLALDPGLTGSVVSAYTEPVRLAARQSESQALLSTLSPRELEVLDLAAEGLTNTEIAAALTVTDLTVKAHLRSIYVRLGVSNRLQAVRVAWEAGLSALARAAEDHKVINGSKFSA